MSFGWSVNDIAVLVRLAHRTAKAARAACGEYDELTREVTGLHHVLNRLKREAKKPDSFLSRPGETYRQDLEPLSSRCKHVLAQLDTILAKYSALSERERSIRKLLKQIRFGTSVVPNVGDLRSKITSCTASLSLVLNLVSMGAVGEVERKMNQAGGDLTDIKTAVNRIAARLSATGSVLTAYTNDDKDAWRELRRGLVQDGFRGSVVRKHMTTIMAYVKEVGNRGALDGIEQLGCEEGSDMPSRQDGVYHSHNECQPALTTGNPEATGSSIQSQPTRSEDDSSSISSAASYDSSATDDSAIGRPLLFHDQLYVESAYETAGEDGHMESPGTASSIRTSRSADDMTGQESSDADPEIRDSLLMDIGEELWQQEVADQRRYKQENDRPRSAEAWDAHDTNQTHLNSNAAFETAERITESDWTWSDFVDPWLCLYQMPLDTHRVPTFIADKTVIYVLVNTPVYNDLQRLKALSAILRFRAVALRISRPNLPARGTSLSLIEREPQECSRSSQNFYHREVKILDRFISSCHRRLARLGQCFIQSKESEMELLTDKAKDIQPEFQPEQINALCLAFIFELAHREMHLNDVDDRILSEIGWPSLFAQEVQDVEDWIRDFNLECMPIVQRMENMPGWDKY